MKWDAFWIGVGGALLTILLGLFVYGLSTLAYVNGYEDAVACHVSGRVSRCRH